MLLLAMLFTAYLLFAIAVYVCTIKPAESNIASKSRLHFSIVICARNEEQNIAECLRSIQHQNYPKAQAEIILVDDFSSDQTAELALKACPNIKLISLKALLPPEHQHKPNKKWGINKAIELAQHEHVLITDADCQFNPNCLVKYAEKFEHGTYDLITGPVLLTGKSIFGKLQSLESLANIAITAFGFCINHPIMANAANLCFKRSEFLTLNPFKDNLHIPSGDDYYITRAFKQEKKKMLFALTKDNLVRTRAIISWFDFMQQRRRWLGKVKFYREKYVQLLGLFIALLNTAVLLGLTLAICQALDWGYFAQMIFLKLLAEIVLVIPTAYRLSQMKLILLSPILSLLFPIYNLIMAILVFTKGYEWKGRKVSDSY